MIHEQSLRRILRDEAARHVVTPSLRKSTAVRARASRAGHIAAAGALVAAIMVAGVGVATHLNAERADNRPAKGGLGAGSDGQIDQRVLDGIAPISGDSMASVRWLEEQIFRLKLPAIVDCLQRKDREDLLPDVEAEFESNLNARRFDFPEPRRLLEEGFGPSSDSPFDKRGAKKDLAVVESCTLDIQASGERAARTQALYQSLNEDWTMILVNDVLTSDVETAAQERFGQCLRRHGVPAEFTVAHGPGSPGGTIEDAFLGWATRQNSTSGAEDANLYVKCGRPLWETREQLLKERREIYTERQRDQLEEFSDLVYETDG